MSIKTRKLSAADPSGTCVHVTLDDGSIWSTRTRSEIWKLGDGTPVVLLRGKTGGYLAARCVVVEEPHPGNPNSDTLENSSPGAQFENRDQRKRGPHGRK